MTNIKKQYKSSMGKTFTSNSTFNDIKHRIDFKVKNKNQKFIFPILSVATATAIVAVIIVVSSNSSSTATGALAYQMSPSISKEIATSSASRLNLHLPSYVAPSFKKQTEEVDFTNLLYEADAMIMNQNDYLIKDIVSNKDDYANAQEVNFSMLNGEEANYILYYNDISTTEVEKKNKSSFEKNFEGVAIYSDLEITFDFLSNEETKNNKSNYSSITTMFMNEEKTDYIKISSESEEKKNKSYEQYKYEKFVDNGLEESYMVNYESKKNKETLYVTMDDETFSITKKSQENQDIFTVKSDSVNICYYKQVAEDGSVTYIKK